MNRETNAPGGKRVRRDVTVTAACVLSALAFGVFLARRFGMEPARQFTAAYLLELGLSIDNVFVFALVFSRFRLDPSRERSVLLWGSVGAILLRTLVLVVGVGAVGRFSWLVPVLGAVILFTGARAAFAGRGRAAADPSGGLTARLTSGLPVWIAALVAVEAADLIFAFDSLPAVIAVTHDARIAVASNLFAIIGLRSLFVIVRSAMASLRYLHAGVSAVLIFVGAKMVAEPWHPLPSSLSLAVIAVLLGSAILASVLGSPGERP
jgi:tellurite resistance protein TerC